MRAVLFMLAATSVLAGCAPAAGPLVGAGAPAPASAAASPAIGTYGFDAAGMERSIPPGRSFYMHANGGWERATAIPADRSNYGMFQKLEELSLERSHAILQEQSASPGSRIGDLFAAFMDEPSVEQAGLRPVAALLAEIEALPSRSAWSAKVGELAWTGVDGPFAGGVGSDERRPNEMIVRLEQSGLGMPDRDYYLDRQSGFAEKRAAYGDHLAKLLALAGVTDAGARAREVLAFETKLAATHWTRVRNRDDEARYNRMSAAELVRSAPGMDWEGYLRAAGFAGQRALLVSQPSAFTGGARIVSETPLPVLRDYLLLRTLNAYSPFLPKAFVDASFAFNEATLNGTPQIEPRWKRGVQLVTSLIPDDLSRIYVARHFTPETKAAADRLVANVTAAMDQRLSRLEWMSQATRTRARAKLAGFTAKIGYPDKWRDYSDVHVSRSDLIGSVRSGMRADYRRDLAKLGRPVDRGEWFMTPMTINAYAYTAWNEIVFPAAILQPPFFDPNADAAVNYGGIGGVIGHEISHHFDDQGSRVDETGALAEWWTPEDRRRFEALTAGLVAQFDEYEALPGRKVNGRLALGENIGDLAGLTIAYDAYRKSLNGAAAPTIGGTSGDQRFYLGWAQIWRRKYREPNLVQRLVTDPHSPSEQRVAIVRNMDPWYEAFRPAETDALFLRPDRRVRIW